MARIDCNVTSITKELVKTSLGSIEVSVWNLDTDFIPLQDGDDVFHTCAICRNDTAPLAFLLRSDMTHGRSIEAGKYSYDINTHTLKYPNKYGGVTTVNNTLLIGPPWARVFKFRDGFYYVYLGGSISSDFDYLPPERYPSSSAWGYVRCNRDSVTSYFTVDRQEILAITNWYLGLNIIDPYGTDDNQTPEGGYGDFDYTSEEELPPQLPALSAAQVGFVSLWNPTTQEMKDLANYLWTGTFDLTNFKKLFTDPMDCVLSVGIIPITPTHGENKTEIVFGGSSHSGVNAYAVTSQFYIEDMGTMVIDGKSKSYMDYSPYTKASIYLPYCGTYALDVDEIMDSTLELEYHIDIYTGACVAYLTVNGHINSDTKSVHATMYQFTGNVLASIPITGNDHSQFIQSMLFMGATAAATVATSGAGAAATGADLGAETAANGFNKALAGSAINTVMSMKPNVLHSGNLSTTAGLLGGQKPYVTFTWSNLCRPDDEYKLVGMPLHRSGTLSDFSGFTIVSACHMDNILCTEQELNMIEQALAKGVIV